MPRRFVYHGTRGPRRTAKEEPAASGQLRIEQVRSEIGHPERLRLTLKSIGLRHHQDFITKQDSPALRGQIKRVRHLVKVTKVEE
jgi:large subunit ribosomal protein L30